MPVLTFRRISRHAYLVGVLLVAIVGCRSALPARSAVANAAKAEVGKHQIQPTAHSKSVREEAGDDMLIPPPLSTEEQLADWSLASIESLALQNNPTLAAASARIDIARGKSIQAGLYPNPVVGYHATEIGNRGTAGQQGAYIRQRFITAGKLKLDEAIGRKGIDEARFLWTAQERRVLSDVRVRYYETLVAHRRVTLTKELFEIGERIVKASKKLLETRQGTENDLVQAELRADEAKILFDNANNELSESWRRLAAVVGTPGMKRKSLEGDLEESLAEHSWDECYGLVLHCNPELNAAHARLERARLAIERARREPIPNIDLTLSVRHHNVTGSDVANIQVGVPIPIFDKNQGNIRASEAAWIRANQEVLRIEADLLDRLAAVFRRYSNARHQVDRYRKRMIPKAKRSLDLVTNGYDKGQVKYLTLLTAQQAYVQVNLSYLKSIQELRSAWAIIEGQLLTESLKSRR